ncbi:ribonuclease H-like domain-containing protein [Tanacetum coccineum]
MVIRAYEEDRRHEELNQKIEEWNRREERNRRKEWNQKIEEDKRREELNQKIEEVVNLIHSFIRNPISSAKMPQPVTTKVPAVTTTVPVKLIQNSLRSDDLTSDRNNKTTEKGVCKEGFGCALNKSKGSHLGLPHYDANIRRKKRKGPFVWTKSKARVVIEGSHVAYLLIYVDDIILTASSPVLLQQIVDSLYKEFDMTDLGALNYFLGISARCGHFFCYSIALQIVWSFFGWLIVILFAALIFHVGCLSKSPFIALKDPNWCNAMYDEYNALVKNGTWILVPRPSDVNLVRSMWLFKHKFHADGTLSRYKARLVANGSNQQHGVDFDETFSPVVKPATIRTVLSLAVSRQWPIHQLDVKNAFLNGDLSETVYMHQPPGFVDSRYPNHVCLLQRSLYGLKQAPRAWFQRFAGYATRAGFSPSRCDSSLFIYTQGSQVAYLLIYVDDIILTASSPVLLQQIVDSLYKEFDMTDLGALNYFLGISVVRHPTGLFLSQKKYARQLLERAHMVNCNPPRTPIDIDSKLGPDGIK